MKMTALLIAIAMVCMTLEGCDSQSGYDTREVMAALEGGITRANQAFIEGFADRPAQIITVDYKPPTASRAIVTDYKPQTP